MSIYIDIIS